MDRRRFLATSGTALVALVAGCVNEPTASNGDGTDTTTRTDTTTSTTPTSTTTTVTAGDVESELRQSQLSVSAPLWRRYGDLPGFVSLLTDAEQFPATHRRLDPELRQWIAATDFSESVVLYVESVGPSTCFGLRVEDLAVEGTTLAGAAAAVDTSEPGQGCGQAITFPSAFVRVTADPLPTRAALSVTNGWGDSGRITSDGPILDPPTLPGGVRPDGDPPQVAGALECPDGEFRRLSGPDESVSWGETPGVDGDPTVALRVGEADDGSLSFGRTEEVRITMTNLAREPVVTGNRHKYALEVLTEAEGWTEVRGTTDGRPLGYTDEAVQHPPGDGFEWTFAMTEAGLVADHPRADRLTVCPDLPAGRYRFAFWGAPDGVVAVSWQFEG